MVSLRRTAESNRSRKFEFSAKCTLKVLFLRHPGTPQAFEQLVNVGTHISEADAYARNAVPVAGAIIDQIRANRIGVVKALAE